MDILEYIFMELFLQTYGKDLIIFAMLLCGWKPATTSVSAAYIWHLSVPLASSGNTVLKW